MTLRTLVILGLLGLPLAAAEEKPLPADLPPYGADRPLPVPKVLRRTLPNGLTVWAVPRQGFPKVSLCLVVKGGMACDPAGQEGLASLLADTLAQGTPTRTSRAIAEEVQALGGTLGCNATADATYLFGDALAPGLARLLDVMGDVTRNAAFPDPEVALAKANALEGLKAESASPGFLASRLFAAEVFGAHPYSRFVAGEEVLKAAAPEALRRLKDRRFRPDRALLVLAGDLDAEAAFRLAEKAFGPWKAVAGPEADPGPAPALGPLEIVLGERAGSVQATLRVGRPAPAAASPDTIPLDLANVIMGGSFDSRITRNIREDKGYTYSPGTGVSSRAAGGLFTARADVRNAVTSASLTEIFYEMDRMGTTDVPAPELDRAKRYMGGIYLFRNQLQGTVVGTLAANWVNGLPPEYLGSYVEKVQAVKASEIRAVSGKYFNPRAMTLVVVGDPAQVKEQLEHFGPVKVVRP